jgi:electron transport complex protein RnfC
MSTLNTATTAEPPVPSSAAPLSLIPPPARLFVPLSTRDGGVHTLPTGTRVVRGQLLTDSAIGARAVALSPVSGRVAGMRDVEVIGLPGLTPAVEIEVDAVQPPQPQIDESHASAAASTDLAGLIDRLRLAGVRAERRTSPDLLAQLHDALRRPIDTVICNLLDVTIESTLNAAVLRWAGRELTAGVSAVAQATGANRTWLAVDPGLSSRAEVLARRPRGGERIRVIELTNDYPQSDPTPLLYAMLARRLRPERLPTEVNTVLLDGVAAAAIGRALVPGGAMLETPVEIRDSRRGRCSRFLVAMGTPLRHVLEAAGLNIDGLTFRAGAALRDIRILSRDAIVDGGELSIDAGPVTPPINPDPCIRCGWCVESCPVRIHPAGLLEAAQDNDSVAAERYGLAACIECGICSYVCPSRLPLLTAIRDLRKRSFPASS